MSFIVPLEKAKADYPEYTFVAALTPSAQKAAFHIRDKEGNDLCLKIIAPNSSIDRLDREIRALQSINHPNVARLKEYTFTSKPKQHRHFLIEEFIEGCDLADKLQPGQQWSTSDSSVFAALCDGLSALKNKNIVHRDLKPTNIRIRSDGSPVIIDFGLARLLDLPDLTSLREGAAFGTPAYFSPEQFTGTRLDIDHRTDLFALGILLYEALVGQHPFRREGMSYQELRDAVCESHDYLTVPEFTELPKPWRLIVGRLIEKERAKRPQDAEQVATILRKIGGE